MIVVGKHGAVQFRMFTGWFLPQNKTAADGISGHYPFPTDLGYHSLVPRHDGQEPMKERDGTIQKCEWVGGKPCYYDGSALAADDVFKVLLKDGSDGVWALLEDRYHELLGGGDE